MRAAQLAFELRSRATCEAERRIFLSEAKEARNECRRGAHERERSALDPL